VDDRLAIQEMIARYSHSYDTRDLDAFAAVFVADAVFEVFLPGDTRPSVRLRSREAIREWAAQRLRERAGRFASRHYQSGTLFDLLTSASARTRTMLLVIHQEAGAAVPSPTRSGVYHDQWRKTRTGWRLARRAAHLDQGPGPARPASPSSP
jgi:hypothetical protein